MQGRLISNHIRISSLSNIIPACD